jgi:hypothetical protein
LNLNRLLNRNNPVVVFKNKGSGLETIITQAWMLTVSDEVILLYLLVLHWENMTFLRFWWPNRII